MGEAVASDNINNEKVQAKVKGFFSNPWVGIITTILGVASFIFGLYAYFVPIGVRSLTYSISPVKAVAVKTGQVSDLMVSYKGIPINTDVIVAQIAIWNKGRLPIREENILKAIRIVTSPTSQILDASVRKQSRDVIGFQLGKANFTEGYIPITWKILERNDGVVIQIVFAGDLDTTIKVTGVIEGQDKVHYYDSIVRSDNHSSILSITSVIASILVCLICVIIAKVKRLKHLNSLFLSIIVCFVIFLIQLGLTTLLNNGGPPFGF